MIPSGSACIFNVTICRCSNANVPSIYEARETRK